MGANSCRPSGTSEQPRKTIRSAGNVRMSFFSNRTSPPGPQSPAMVFRRVDFPAPLAPMTVTISPGPM